MASFADMFSGENIGKLMNDPRLILGLQLMQQSGPQAGNPSGGQRLGQAGIGAMQQIAQSQHQQALQQYRQSQMQQQEQALVMQQQAAQQKVAQQQQWQRQLQDPNFLANLGPTARALASAGIDPSDLLRANSADALNAHRQAQMEQSQAQFEATQSRLSAGGGNADHGPKQPAMRQVLEEPLDNGMMQKHVWDAASNSYKPYGKPYRQYAKTKEDPLDALVGQIMPADTNDGPGPAVAGLPGIMPMQSYSPVPQPATATPMVAAGANPAAREGTRVPGSPKPATPMTKAEYDALPVGASYVDPVSGKTAVKKGR